MDSTHLRNHEIERSSTRLHKKRVGSWMPPCSGVAGAILRYAASSHEKKPQDKNPVALALPRVSTLGIQNQPPRGIQNDAS